VDLETEEDRAEHGYPQGPEPELGDVVVAQCVQRQHHQEAGHQQHERADGGERDVEHVGGERADDAAVVIGEVGADQRTEEHAVRREEHPHQQLDVGQTRATEAGWCSYPARYRILCGGASGDVRAHAPCPSASGWTWCPPTPSKAHPKIMKMKKNPLMMASIQLS